MSKSSAARRLATAAVVGSGGLSVLGATAYGVLRGEAIVARKRIGNATITPPDPSGLYGFDLPGTPIRLAVLGDSAAAGYGAETGDETFGAYLASGLADLAHAPVFLECVAVVGAETSDLEEQIPGALAAMPDVCAVIIGANDVTHRVKPRASLRALKDAVRRLRASGAQVVVGTCPDLGTIRPIAPPLRQLARRLSRQLAAAQLITVVEADGRGVSLATILGPEFAANGADLFGPDRFHPSPAGYRACAGAMLPSVAASIGVGGEPDLAEPDRGDGVRSLASAAVEAAGTTGTELSQAAESAAGRSTRPWALLRYRRRHLMPVEGEIDHRPPEPADFDANVDNLTHH